MNMSDEAKTGYAQDDLFRFDASENEIYDLQIPVLKQNLQGAVDTLSNYTCHSEMHIVEVMEQSELLLTALRDWLFDTAGFSEDEMPRIRKHLLLAAKFHDVGMAGSPALRRLLFLSDEMHDACRRARSAHFAFHGETLSEFESLAQTADLECSRWDAHIPLYGRLCKRIIYRSNPSEICEALESYHELVKNTIRKYHAENSGKWIMQNSAALSRRYGHDIPWDAVALIAALHTGKLWSHTDENGATAGWRDYCARLCALLGIDGAFLQDPRMERRFLALVSILRVADQRRSGSRLRMLDKSPVNAARAADGRLVIEYTLNGVAHRSALSRSNAMILSERLNEFGPVEMRREADHWVMTHHLSFSHTENESGRRALICQRIPSYLMEIQESTFQVSPDLMHILSIDVDGQGKQPSEAALSYSMADMLSLEAPMRHNNKSLDAIDEHLRRYSGVIIHITP